MGAGAQDAAEYGVRVLARLLQHIDRGASRQGLRRQLKGRTIEANHLVVPAREEGIDWLDGENTTPAVEVHGDDGTGTNRLNRGVEIVQGYSCMRAELMMTMSAGSLIGSNPDASGPGVYGSVMTAMPSASRRKLAWAYMMIFIESPPYGRRQGYDVLSYMLGGRNHSSVH